VKVPAIFLLLLGAVRTFAGPYAPAAGQPGSGAVSAVDPRIVGWATGVSALTRGLVDISDPQSPFASFGGSASAIGAADAYDFGTGLPSTSPNTVVSLGDGGAITLTFANPLRDGIGPDFAVFENAFNDSFLELAFVEVSSDGTHFERFPAFSLTQTNQQIAQQNSQFNAIDPTDIDGLAGKYRAGFGTPFDLGLLAGRPLLDLQNIIAVRVIDVVGSLDPLYGSLDSSVPAHLINEPWPTPFATGGFDLDAVAVLQSTPEPGSALLLGVGGALLTLQRRRGLR